MPRNHRKLPKLSSQDIERFWSKVDKSPGQGPKGECWTWTGCLNDSSYGMFSINNKAFRASRVSYFLSTGVDPGELLICHQCDNPPCVRPEELFPGTQADNVEDAKQKGRIPKGDQHHSRRNPHSMPHGQAHWINRQPTARARLSVSAKARPLASFARGNQLPQTKYDPAQVREIRRRFAANEATISGMAREDGVSTATIFNIIHRNTHKHVL